MDKPDQWFNEKKEYVHNEFMRLLAELEVDGVGVAYGHIRYDLGSRDLGRRTVEFKFHFGGRQEDLSGPIPQPPSPRQ